MQARIIILNMGLLSVFAKLKKVNETNCHWLAQQMTEACGADRDGPRYLIHDRDCCYGAVFNRRVQSLGMKQIRTPVKAPMANAIAECWVRTVRSECLDHQFIFGYQSLQRILNEY